MELRLGCFYGGCGGSIVWFSACGYWIGDFWWDGDDSSNGVLQVGLTMGFWWDGDWGIGCYGLGAKGGWGGAWLENGNGHC